LRVFPSEPKDKYLKENVDPSAVNGWQEVGPDRRPIEADEAGGSEGEACGAFRRGDGHAATVLPRKTGEQIIII